MSDGMEFTMPEPVANPLTDADLQRLTAEAVTYWAKSGNWTIEQACALLRGFVPLEEWEPDYPIKRILLQTHTAPLQAEITRQSTEPLPASLPPQQWLEKAEKCGKVYAPIKFAILTSDADPQPTGTSNPPKALEAMRSTIMEWADEIEEGLQHNGNSTTNETIAKRLADKMSRNNLVMTKGKGKGEAYSWKTIDKWFLHNRNRPDSQ